MHSMNYMILLIKIHFSLNKIRISGYGQGWADGGPDGEGYAGSGRGQAKVLP